MDLEISSANNFSEETTALNLMSETISEINSQSIPIPKDYLPQKYFFDLKKTYSNVFNHIRSKLFFQNCFAELQNFNSNIEKIVPDGCNLEQLDSTTFFFLFFWIKTRVSIEDLNILLTFLNSPLFNIKLLPKDWSEIEKLLMSVSQEKGLLHLN
jgi:hypothetical protein